MAWIPNLTSNSNAVYRRDNGVGLALGRTLLVNAYAGTNKTAYESERYTTTDVITLQRVVLSRGVRQITKIDTYTKSDDQPMQDLSSLYVGGNNK